mgnify:FL=1
MKNSLTTNNKTPDYDVPIHSASGGSDLRHLMSHLWHMVDFPRFNDSVSPEPKIEVAENKSNVTVTAEIPGVAEKDIDLQISSDGYLTISAEKKDENSSQDKDHYFSEISYGMVKRTIPLPWDLDYNKADAEYNDGLLRIVLPKSNIEQQKVKKISVKKSKTSK